MIEMLFKVIYILRVNGVENGFFNVNKCKSMAINERSESNFIYKLEDIL